MIERGVFSVEPWAVGTQAISLDVLAQTESIFSLGNGYIGLRGTLDEGEPRAVPGSYLNGFFESIPMPHAEVGYAYPDEIQALVDVTDGKSIRLLVGDEPLDVRYGTLWRHERALDFRDGVLRRDFVWTSPADVTVRVRSTRLVSFVHRSIAAVRYEVEAVGAPTGVTIESPLVVERPTPDQRGRRGAFAPLIAEHHAHYDLEVALGHRTLNSGLRMAAGLDHVVEGPPGTTAFSESEPNRASVAVRAELLPGETLEVVKLIAYGWSGERSMPALRDQVDAALAAAKRSGWEWLARAQRAYLDDFWERADVEVEGDAELQQAIRFALFHTLQSAARAERSAIPAKGLTGPGYDGHTFWDMDTYALPMLTYTTPKAARDALRWRHETLPLARARARELRLEGAAFPWRTIRGDECSGYWPAATAAFHINADVAEAARRYIAASGDEDFERGPGLELLIETARLWLSLGHHDPAGRFRIDGVTGPDEYSAVADNNVFTNLMAAKNLRAAAHCAARHPDRARELEVDEAEIARWRRAAAAIVIPFDEELGVTAQSEGFTRLRRWRFEATPPGKYPLLLHYPYYLLYSSQVVKQADLVFAHYMCGECWSAEQKRRDFDYYEAITVRDSSLSAPIQAIVAAEVGHLDLAYAYFREAALIDLRDTSDNTGDGLHLGSLAGSWLVAAAGFGGMRDYGETLAFAPRLPEALERISFRMTYRGSRVRIDLRPGSASYELISGAPLELRHHGKRVRVAVGSPVVEPCVVHAPLPPARPPAGREPGHGFVASSGASSAKPRDPAALQEVLHGPP